MNYPEKGRYYRVIKDYNSAYPVPLIMKAGEKLHFENKESEWPGWVWCTNAEGNSRWAPESFITKRGTGAVMQCDYDATELTVTVGDKLEIVAETAGWARCINDKGESGWVPLDNVEIIQKGLI